jgi:hypothetical protein
MRGLKDFKFYFLSFSMNYLRISAFRILVIISFSFFCSCNKAEKKANTIIQQSGKNADELQKVLDHYSAQGEKEKYRAACFLIANMRNKHTTTSSDLKSFYTTAFDVIHSTGGSFSREELDEIMKNRSDSVISVHGVPNTRKFQKSYDISNVSSEFLIKNIDLAFKAWAQPWARHVEFDQFCEYILPYRIHDEPLSNWREIFFERYISFADSVKDPSDPKQMVEAVSNYVYNRWTHLDNFNSFGCFPSVLQMDTIDGGNCDHRYFLVTAISRSIGLPVAIEGTPQWTNYSGGHSWNVILDRNGVMRPFNGGEDNFRFYEKNLIPMGDGGSICTKVYREMYGYQETSLPGQGEKNPFISFFESPCMIDVTVNYDFPKTRLEIEIENEKLDGKIVYLALFNYGWDINTIAWAKVKNGKADFGYVGLPAFYIPVYYDFGGKPVMVHEPMVMYKEEEKRHLYNPDLSKKRNVKLFRKFSFSGEFLGFADGLVGCKIQGSNEPDFKDAKTLHVIEKKAKGYEQEVFENDSSFRYIRLMSADSSDVSLAELEFWGTNKLTGKGEMLKGRFIGSASVKDEENDAVIENAFDENIRTNYNGKRGSWIGLDLGEKASEYTVNKIWFLPRNNYNVIEKGHVYELFYLGDRWISLGKKRGRKYFLEYDNVPSDALLLLKNHTAGRQERIFMYNDQNQEQVWW